MNRQLEIEHWFDQPNLSQNVIYSANSDLYNRAMQTSASDIDASYYAQSQNALSDYRSVLAERIRIHISWDVKACIPRLSNIEVLPILSEWYNSSCLGPFKRVRHFFSFKTWVFIIHKMIPTYLYKYAKVLKLPEYPQDNISKPQLLRIVLAISDAMCSIARRAESRQSKPLLDIMQAYMLGAFPDPEDNYFFME